MRFAVKSAMLLGLALAATVFALAQETRGPSTREERADAVRLARILEDDPFTKEAKKMREWFNDWLLEIPDMRVDLCTGYLEPLYQKKNKNYASIIYHQFLFSSAAYMIDHPDQADDKTAISQAGLEGALKAYRSILRKKPDRRWPFLDDLINRRDRGELKAYVEEIAATKCTGKK